MPSHQERIRQNNCNHSWYHYWDQLGTDPTKLFKECLKCGKKILVLDERADA